jgi:hypothetical protein
VFRSARVMIVAAGGCGTEQGRSQAASPARIAGSDAGPPRLCLRGPLLVASKHQIWICGVSARHEGNLKPTPVLRAA